MESVASSNTQAPIKNCPVFASRKKESFPECKSKLRVCLSLYYKTVFEVLQGKAQTSSSTLGSTVTATLNAVAAHKWLQANHDLCSVLLLTTSGPANNAVKKVEGKRPEDGAGHGQLAWKALTEKYNGHTKEATRACHEKLVNTKMEPARIRTTSVSFWTRVVTSSRKWDRQYTTTARRQVRGHHSPSPSARVREGTNCQLREAGLGAGRHSAHGTHYVCRQPFARCQR